MNPFTYFIPHTYTYHSDINGEIKVHEFLGKVTLFSGGVTQSGGFTHEMWHLAVKRITNHESRIKNCLVLGVGGGTIIDMLKNHVPGVTITGIDIDPVMVEIAKKHFHIGTNPKVLLMVDDAVKYVVNHADKSIYDLIVVDLYIGRFNPKSSHETIFLKGIRALMKKDGMVFFNTHYNQTDNKEYDDLINYLKGIFTGVEEIISYRLSKLLILS